MQARWNQSTDYKSPHLKHTLIRRDSIFDILEEDNTINKFFAEAQDWFMERFDTFIQYFGEPSDEDSTDDEIEDISDIA
ncbi:hypothetical protein DSO57_1019884 [Entomophthora muscae]|uniref:Uncharacterized protein n=1 Tax=Entomophthora muscae TaxID=34485 RepID=A0ACC2U271_9FUNG|nr:hypothetical protein DSO57_1019884 [Entomophthora muscae]